MILGTALRPSATKVLLLGSGELGKEVVIELQRLGIETIAVDRYPQAPAMQVAHRSHVISMLDPQALENLIRQEKPDFIIPEIEAIHTETLQKLEKEGFQVIPTATAARLTMDRERIRRLAAETLGLPTSRYFFSDTFSQAEEAAEALGFPLVMKPVMSSSGKGQSLVKHKEELRDAWEYAMQGGRGKSSRVILESFIDFDYEITLLTVRHLGGTTFLSPIGHRQVKGDYHESWMPQPMSTAALNAAQKIALKITNALGGRGIFGVELFVKGDMVWFSEVSPRPHDTGMVTMISQNYSEFALHVRAILGLPMPAIHEYGPAASYVLLARGHSNDIRFSGLNEALLDPEINIRLFGKPEVKGERRLGVVLALGATIEEARNRAAQAVSKIKILSE